MPGTVSSPAPLPGPPLVPGRLLFDNSGDGLTAELGTSLVYDSNLFQDPDATESGLLSTTDLSLHYHRGTGLLLGAFGGVDYDLAYFQYMDDKLNEGREPFEHDLSGFVGVKGADTTITLSGSFARNNGNNINQQRIERETLNSESTSYSLNLSLSRKLRRTTLTAGVGYQLQDFAGGAGLTDLTQWNGRLGWSVSPLPTPKTDFSLGVSFGTSEQRAGVTQDSLSPTAGINYRYSPLTTFFGSAGVSMRRTNGQSAVPSQSATASPAPATGTPGTATTATAVASSVPDSRDVSFTAISPVFDLGVSWQPRSTTSVAVSVFRRTSASALQGQSSSDTTGISLTGSQMLPHGFSASLNYSFENASYTDSSGADVNGNTGTGRPENFHRLGANLGRQFQLRGRLVLSSSLYYQYILANGSDPLSEFEKHIFGLRMGLAF